MTTFPIGVRTRSLRSPLRQAIGAAAELGADGVEIDARNEIRVGDFSQTALRQFRKLLDDLGLRVAALEFPTRRGLGDPEDLDRRLGALRDAMGLAYKLGARVVVHHAVDLPDADGAGPGWATLRESLAALAEYGDHVGATLAIASSAPPEEQAKLLDGLPEGSLAVALNPAGLVGAGESSVEAAALLGARVRYVRAADAVREIAGGGGRVVEAPLGRGSADFPAVLGTLEEHGYRGWVTAERNDGSDPRGDLANAVAFLRAI